MLELRQVPAHDDEMKELFVGDLERRDSRAVTRDSKLDVSCMTGRDGVEPGDALERIARRCG